MKIKNVFISIFVIMSLFSVAFAETSPSNIGKAMMSLCGQIKSALAIGMMLLIVLAAITYAVGQMMGAETRARASVWATAMFVGSLIGALIYIIMPFILSILINGTADTAWVNNCCVDPPGTACNLIK